jgi:putative hydrolase of the HAD superfamily
LFDLDNTLADREAAFRRWATAFLGDRDLPDVVADMVAIDGDGMAPRSELFSWLRTTFALNDSTEQLVEEYREQYPSYFDVSSATFDALAQLREAGWRIGIVTNGAPSQQRKLEVTGLLGVVDGVCISAEVGVNKPDPAIFHEAARRCGVALDGWMVGDSAPADIAGGINCQLRTVWITRGRTWSETNFAPTAQASTISDAVQILLG